MNTNIRDSSQSLSGFRIGILFIVLLIYAIHRMDIGPGASSVGIITLSIIVAFVLFSVSYSEQFSKLASSWGIPTKKKILLPLGVLMLLVATIVFLNDYTAVAENNIKMSNLFDIATIVVLFLLIILMFSTTEQRIDNTMNYYREEALEEFKKKKSNK